MKVAVVIAAYEQGTTGEYVNQAFLHLGYSSEILSQYQFYDSFKALPQKHDLYFCVDSGGPLNLTDVDTQVMPMKNLAFWMIDFRRGKTLKNPSDWETVKIIERQGGWIFQSQFEDFRECLSSGITSCSWLPLAADLDVWQSEPEVQKSFDVGFIGNVWDGARQEILDGLRSRFSLGFPGHGGMRMQQAAQMLRSCRIGFNVSSFFGTDVAFDVNMRVYETLSCGIPLVTNYVPSLNKVFNTSEGEEFPKFIRVFYSIDDAYRVVGAALRDEAFLNSGDEAREWIERGNSYQFRMQQALMSLKSNKRIK